MVYGNEKMRYDEMRVIEIGENYLSFLSNLPWSRKIRLYIIEVYIKTSLGSFFTHYIYIEILIIHSPPFEPKMMLVMKRLHVRNSQHNIHDWSNRDKRNRVTSWDFTNAVFHYPTVIPRNFPELDLSLSHRRRWVDTHVPAHPPSRVLIQVRLTKAAIYKRTNLVKLFLTQICQSIVYIDSEINFVILEGKNGNTAQSKWNNENT